MRLREIDPGAVERAAWALLTGLEIGRGHRDRDIRDQAEQIAPGS